MPTIPVDTFNPEKHFDSGIHVSTQMPTSMVVNTSASASPSSIYDVPSYVWDGKSRPNIDDYTRPWSQKASDSMYSWAFTDYRKAHNAEITYAKNKLNDAIAQYENDLAFWNEMDERWYTSQASQAQRYEDAGFNLGYLYDKIDSGNSAVGYAQGDSQYTPAENYANEGEIVKTVSSVISSCVGVVSSLINAGVNLAQLPARIKQMTAAGELTSIQANWQRVLQSVGTDGKKIDDVSKSIAFALQQMNYKQSQQSLSISAENLKHLQEFTLHAAKIYTLQGTDPRKEASDSLQKMIKSMDLSWLGDSAGFGRFVLQMLGFWAIKDI